MIVFTQYGLNTFAFMVLQLYNFHVDEELMRTWCPFHLTEEQTIFCAVMAQSLRWIAASSDLESRKARKARLAAKRKAVAQEYGSQWLDWPPIIDRGWPSGAHNSSIELSSMCGEPNAPCQCKQVFPRAAEVWQPVRKREVFPRKRGTPAAPEVPWSEGWSMRWSYERNSYTPTYCFMREMRAQYMHEMGLQQVAVDPCVQLHVRKDAQGQLYRWQRHLWLRTARRALRLRLFMKDDVVDKVMTWGVRVAPADN